MVTHTVAFNLINMMHTFLPSIGQETRVTSYCIESVTKSVRRLW